MKLVGAISTAVLSLTLGVGIPAYAQQEQHDQQEENKNKPAQEEKKAQTERNAQQDKNNSQEGKNAQQQDKNNKQEEKSAQQQDKNTKQEEKNAQQQDRNNQQEQRNAQQQQAQHASNNGGGRIPADRYKANFGQEHHFRVSQADYSNHRFQYGGYWFGFEGLWPSNWLYSQDVYVIEIDGVYYLCNVNYPGINIVLSVTL